MFVQQYYGSVRTERDGIAIETIRDGRERGLYIKPLALMSFGQLQEDIFHYTCSLSTETFKEANVVMKRKNK